MAKLLSSEELIAGLQYTLHRGGDRHRFSF